MWTLILGELSLYVVSLTYTKEFFFKMKGIICDCEFVLLLLNLTPTFSFALDLSLTRCSCCPLFDSLCVCVCVCVCVLCGVRCVCVCVSVRWEIPLSNGLRAAGTTDTSTSSFFSILHYFPSFIISLSVHLLLSFKFYPQSKALSWTLLKGTRTQCVFIFGLYVYT